MKALILASLFFFSVASFADTIEANKQNSELFILDLVVGFKHTYSETAELEAKAIELLVGDGMNATRMVLILNTGYHDTKIFELGVMMVEVRRIIFLAKDVIIVNYTQETFDENDNQIFLDKALTIKVKRNADNTLADVIEVL